jgi:SAM-dependent methyltransferase
MRRFFDFLSDPLLAGMDVDGVSRLDLHRTMLAKKRMLRDVFTEFHHLFKKLDQQFFTGKGAEVELGAGISPMRDSYPNVLATDIVDATHLDKVINAEAMDLPDISVRTIYGQNCFHHFPHPDKFLFELERVLIPGGGAILLEPYYGPFASYLFKRISRTEGFDKNSPSWETPYAGPMNGANQALSYIVFVRDRSELKRKHPSLEIVHEQRVGNYLKYVISGGLNFRQLLPDCMTGTVSFIEKLLWPLNFLLALHHIVVIRKKAS